MKWLHRLFESKAVENSRSQQDLKSDLGDVTLTLLAELGERLEKPLSAEQRQSAEQTLDNTESVLSETVMSPAVITEARQRILRLRQKLSESSLLKKCGGCGSGESDSLEVVRDKNQNRGYLCSACKSEHEHLLQGDSNRFQSKSKRFWMCGSCGYRILEGTKVDIETDQTRKCPNCWASLNITLVNLSGDQPI
jgi:rubrerythrin